jgi:hypothetical protein
LKNQIAIFAFFIFFLAQFGKVLNFCFCTIATYQQTKTLNCDCEKQLSTAIDTESKKQTPQSRPALPQFDELFHLSNAPAFTSRYFILPVTWPKNNSEPLYNAFLQHIFRPPLQVS